MSRNMQDSLSLYGIRHWDGGGFGTGDDGNVCARPNVHGKVDLYSRLLRLKRTSPDVPLLLRFPCIQPHRARRLCGAFDTAIADAGYGGAYTTVYPIKVNQQAALPRSLIAAKGARVSLEADS